MSEPDPQTTQVFWDEAHQADSLPHLTGSPLADELYDTRAADLVGAGKPVLNVGVGRGDTTRGLVEMGCRVSIHDISAVPFSKFHGLVEAAYLPAELPTMPDRYFDVALSHLVIQHMNDEQLVHQLQHVVRSLKDDGIFAIQFATAWEHEANSIRHDLSATHKPYCRTLARITEMAENAGGAVVYAEMMENFPRFKMLWYAAHIMPAPALRTRRPPSALRAFVWDEVISER